MCVRVFAALSPCRCEKRKFCGRHQFRRKLINLLHTPQKLIESRLEKICLDILKIECFQNQNVALPRPLLWRGVLLNNSKKCANGAAWVSAYQNVPNQPTIYPHIHTLVRMNALPATPPFASCPRDFTYRLFL